MWLSQKGTWKRGITWRFSQNQPDSRKFGQLKCESAIHSRQSLLQICLLADASFNLWLRKQNTIEKRENNKISYVVHQQ